MEAIIFLLLVFGTVCFGLATFGVGGRINLVAAGLCCWILTVLLPVLARVFN
jgi:hypothetical protein